MNAIESRGFASQGCEEIARDVASLNEIIASPIQCSASAIETPSIPVGPVPVYLDDRYLAEFVRGVISARKKRATVLPAELLHDPAWEILLNLFLAELAQQRVTASSLRRASCVSATTALRWISTLTDRGYLVRSPDPLDGRRVFISMNARLNESMRFYFRELLANSTTDYFKSAI